MVFVLRAIALLALMPSVRGAYPCPSGWTTLSGSPSCVGLTSGTCSVGTCCSATATFCSSFSVSWITSSKCSASKFFDLKKASAVVEGSQSDDDIKAACCTPFTDATCADWSKACPVGNAQYKTLTGAAPPDSENTLSQTKFNELCCRDRATCSSHTCPSGRTPLNADTKCPGDASTCSDAGCCQLDTTPRCAMYLTAWMTKQIQECFPDNKFFDTKKATAVVSGAQSDDDIKASCCTAFADATCADWLQNACAAGDVMDTTAAAPPETAGDTTMGDAKFKTLCCKKRMKCADYTSTTTDTSAALANTFPFAGSLASVMALLAVNMA